MKKRILSFFLVLCFAAALLPAVATPAEAAWNTDYDLEGYTEAGKLIAVAMAQNGKRRADLGYSTS